MYKILSINPGSTSTKIAIYEDEQLLNLHTIRHSVEELSSFKKVFDQYEFRKNVIIKRLADDEVDLNELSAVVGRGGLMRPLSSGTYEVNDTMISDLRNGGQHVSNLGALLAREIANSIPNCKSYIADPVTVDELSDVARISGLPQFPRRSTFHALNHKAIGRKYAQSVGTSYEKLNLVIAHLGGGVSIAAHRYGNVVDTNQALDGFGPFSPERSGTIDAGALVRACFEKQFSREEIGQMLVGKGGLMAHLGTNDVKEIAERISSGDEYAALVLNAMAYNIGKEIAAMLAVLEGKVDAVILTGGIANNQNVVNYIKKMISTMSHLVVYPGENEMEALAFAGLRALRGEPTKIY
jgi:butyrate kinase